MGPQNYGILLRRYENYPESIENFRKAKEIWPPYCENDYWEGASLLNMGRYEEAIDILKEAVKCKYTRAKAFEALHALFQIRLSQPNEDSAVSTEWFVSLLLLS